MIIKYEFADGTKSEVEVDETIGTLILDSRREESNYDRKERYHCYSLDALEYEGIEYADDSNPCDDIIREEGNAMVSELMNQLTDIQRRRFTQWLDGKTMREIAAEEGVDPMAVCRSIEKAKNKIKKLL